MKKKVFTILMAVLMVFALMPMTAGTAYAASEPITIDGVTYTVNEEDQTASVTGHADNCPANIMIPGTIKINEKTYPVIAVEEKAFFFVNLETVTFETGSNLTSIGNHAFQACENLKNITIPASVTSIGQEAFWEDGIETVTFEAGSRLETIGKAAFQNNGELTAITIPASVRSVGEIAFEYTGLNTVTFEAGSKLETIGKAAFHNIYNESLTAITIPASVTSIDKDAFLDSGLSLVHYIGDETAWDGVQKGDRFIPDNCAIHYAVAKDIVKARPHVDGYCDYFCNEAGCSEWGYRATIISGPADFTLSKTSYTYDGTAKNPAVTVKDADGQTIDPANYDVAYSKNVQAGTATATATFKGDWYEGTESRNFTINKGANTLNLKGKTVKIKAKKLKKKARTLAAGKVITFTNKGQGTLTYAKVSGNKKIKINAKNGTVTIKKKLKKGTYKVTVKVKAAGNANYEAVTKSVAFKIKVK